MAWTYEATKAGYANMWASLAIRNVKGADSAARRIIAAEAKYSAVEKQTGVPWYFIGILHMRESSNNFAGVLHNGEHIIGKGVKTKLVPKGRGPFGTWEEAAIDALKLKGLHKIGAWDISRIGYEAERFNGLGYTAKGINSPYLWAGSNHQQSGKYVADGMFSRSATDTQLGVMTVLKRICELRPDVAADFGGGSEKPRVEYEPKPAIKSKSIVAEAASLISVVMGWIASTLGFITDWRFILFIVVAVSVYVIYERMKKGDIVSWFKMPKPVKKKRKRKK